MTLKHYINSSDSIYTHDYLHSKLKELKALMIEDKVIVRDLTSKNICCRILKDKSLELIVVDGVGHRDFIPLVEWFRPFTKRKIDKIFKKKLTEFDF